jgi:Holliday junction resolvasome RuvABC endonuclease subunit
MSHKQEQPRILAVALSTRGFGFAVMEGQDDLVKYGSKSAEGDKNARCLANFEKLIDFYEPDILVLSDVAGKGTLRAPRIKVLTRQIVKASGKHKLKVKMISAKLVKRVFFADGQGTKHARAEMIAKMFPNELDLRLPRKRQTGYNEDRNMDFFDAVALAVTYFKLWNQQ